MSFDSFDSEEERETRENETEETGEKKGRREGSRKRERERQDESLVLEAASVNEALSAAAKQWGVSTDVLDAEVIGSERGFLGLFGNKLQVRVRPKKPLVLLRSVDFANRLLELMGFEAKADFQEDGETLDIRGADAAKYIVARYGDCLKSMEYLLNLALRDPSREPRVRLDSSGYRERRIRSLERLAEATARQAVEYNCPIRLDPMLSWERWVIHTTLKDRDDVRTESVGEAPLRKVVVMPRFDETAGSDGSYRPRRRSRYPGRRYRN